MTLDKSRFSLVKIALSSMIGNAIEWYDFVIFGYFTEVMGKLFFPASSPIVQLIYTLGAFAAGFLARPLGAVVFGHIGDKVSRRLSLSLSLYAMAIATTLIGILPTYQTIGIWAPIFLVIFRAVQGLAIGGEFTSSMVFLVEHSPKSRQGIIGSLAPFSLIFGVIAGSSVAAFVNRILTPDQILDWGWRLPFVLSVGGGVLAAYIRKQLPEPESFLEKKKDLSKSKLPFIEICLFHKKSVGLIVLLEIMIAVGFFSVAILLPIYYARFLNINVHTVHIIHTVSMICFSLFVLLGGYLADKIAKLKLMRKANLGVFLLAFPVYFFMSQVQGFNIAYLEMLFVIPIGIFFGALPSFIVNVLPSSVRMSGVSLGHNLSMGIFGGLTPIASVHLIHYYSDLMIPCYFIMVASVLTMLSFRSIQKKAEVEGLVEN